MNAICADEFTLEPQTAGHAGAMFSVLSDPAIYEFENEPPPSLSWLAERYSRLESRRSPNGDEDWLNWVIRLPGGELVGFVQATVRKDRPARIAYVLGSRYWGRGYAFRAVRAMMNEVAQAYGACDFAAIFKRRNVRSRRLLERLGFAESSSAVSGLFDVEPDEVVMDLRSCAIASIARPNNGAGTDI